MRVKIKKLHPDAVIPKYATSGASGFDLVAIEDVEINPGETKLIKTGLAFKVPEGYELQVRPRSGVSLKTPMRVANSPGTVDADFIGEVCVIITNTADNHYSPYTVTDTGGCVGQYVKKGDRIAQGVICPVVQADFKEVEELDNTVRGAGGFGSTGSN